jgi:hypothetical protein
VVFVVRAFFLVVVVVVIHVLSLFHPTY